MTTDEARLKHEYEELLPKMKKLQSLLDASLRWYLKDEMVSLTHSERIDISSRFKNCESAINKLKRILRNKKEGESKSSIDPNHYYSLTKLKDLVGIRISVFPASKVKIFRQLIADKFADWQEDVDPKHSEISFYKFHGLLPHPEYNDIKCEIQIVPMLIGKFWDVEHFMLYKPKPADKNASEHAQMAHIKEDIYGKFKEFEECFEKVLAKRNK